MKFKRGNDIKETLSLGIAKKIPIWMKDSDRDYEDYYQVWTWALENSPDYDILFPFIVERNGKKWYQEKVKITENNNELLWISISFENISAIKALLKYGNLFRKETFTMELWTSELKDEFTYRGNNKIPMRATNFGTFVHHAKKKDNSEMVKVLMEYYKNH